jgi:RNA polymerase sigma-70 factor (ECF subfamily)
VQESFARLLAQPAQKLPEPGPWLARVATNLSVDALRRRRRRSYTGPWLPSPLEEDAADALFASDGPSPEARYGLAESATYAFLLALEALSPRQRAALILRDVLGHSAREAADALGTSEGSVRVLHLRARKALAGYDAERCVPDAALQARHREALQRFLACLLAQDAAGLEALLSESVSTLTDSAGEFTALPALFVTLARPVRRQAPRTLLRLELDAADRIRAIHAILAPRKLARL